MGQTMMMMMITVIWISESFIRRSRQEVGTSLVSHISDRATPLLFQHHDDVDDDDVDDDDDDVMRYDITL